MNGVRLLLAHPELPKCEECKRTVFSPQKGWSMETRPDAKGNEQPVEREPGDPGPPCFCCPKIPRGQEPCPEVGVHSELTDQNWQAWTHYVRCKAVLRFPADDIVEHNAGLIRMVEDQIDREATIEPMVSVLNMLAMKRRE